MNSFRKVFNYENRIFWYPPHQSKALMQLKNGVHHIDMVVEVRDMRIPLTSINRQFDDILGLRDRLVVYNKVDLAKPNMIPSLKSALANYRNEENVIFTQAKLGKGKNVRQILDFAIKKCKENPIRFPYLSIVVVGPPNVGKSTIINSLRNLGVKKGKVAQVGRKAGVTRKIQTRVRINEDPPVYLFDTPGIFNPTVATPQEGLKIALTGGTNDSLTSMVNVADYLLFRLNNSPNIHKYPAVLGLKGPSDDIYTVLSHVCKEKSFIIPKNSRLMKCTPEFEFDSEFFDPNLDYEIGGQYLVDLYRDGEFGQMCLDDCSEIGYEASLRETKFKRYLD